MNFSQARTLNEYPRGAYRWNLLLLTVLSTMLASFEFQLAPGHLSYQWQGAGVGGVPHEEFLLLFEDIARDFENRVVILTGTGESF